MNILFVNSSRTLGGGERWLVDICKGLSGKGHAVTVVCHPGSALEQRIPEVVPDTVPISLTGDLNPFSIYSIYRTIKKRRIDLVCTNFEKDLRIGGIAAMLAGVPVVPSREVDVPIKNSWINELFYSRLAAGMMVNSYATLNTLLNNSPWLQAKPLEVVWKGLPLPPENSAEPSSIWRSSSSDILIGFIGRLDEQKGIPTLLPAIRKAIEVNNKIRLIIAGEGNLYGMIDSFRREHHLEENIILAGFQSDINAFYASVDFVVVPSYWEGFGYTALEAMLHAKAVVASHASSLPELVVDGTTGVLVPPRSPEDLAIAMLTLSAEPTVRDHMGEEGRCRAVQLFSMADMINKTESFFLRLIKR